MTINSMINSNIPFVSPQRLPVAVDHQHVSAAVPVVPPAKTQRLQELSIPFSS